VTHPDRFAALSGIDALLSSPDHTRKRARNFSNSASVMTPRS
jgi:hypothetical protein